MPAAIAVVGVAASVYSANKQSKAAKQSAQAGTDAANQANATELQIYNQSRADNEPFRLNALTAQNEYMQLMGLQQQAPQSTGFAQAGYERPTQWVNGTGPAGSSDPLYQQAWDEVSGLHQQQFGRGFNKHSDMNAVGSHVQEVYDRLAAQRKPQNTMTFMQPAKTPEQLQQDAFARFRSNPGYQFGMTEGQRALESGASAQGGLFSGKTGKALMRYGRDYSDQQGYTPYMNRLASLANMGQTANSQNQQAGQSYASGFSNNLANAANARASGLAGQANAQSGMAQNIAGIGGWLAGQYNKPVTGVQQYPTQSWASNFGNNTGWLS
jgi:hypothetical protein